jgi:hypothetical protein
VTAPRVTGIQAAQVAIAQLVHGWREQLSPREYVVLIDLLTSFLEEERRRIESTTAGRRYLDGTEEGA